MFTGFIASRELEQTVGTVLLAAADDHPLLLWLLHLVRAQNFFLSSGRCIWVSRSPDTDNNTTGFVFFHNIFDTDNNKTVLCCFILCCLLFDQQQRPAKTFTLLLCLLRISAGLSAPVSGPRGSHPLRVPSLTQSEKLHSFQGEFEKKKTVIREENVFSVL